MIALLGTLAAKALFNARRDVSTARSWWGELSPSTRKWIVRLILIVAGSFIHQHYAHRALKAADQAGYDRAKAEDSALNAKAKADAAEARAGAEAKASGIANQGRITNEKARRGNAADTGALLVRGPGAAATHCRPVDHTGLSATASGLGQSAAQPDAARPQVPAGDWALVPWSWLVKRGQEHDDLISEAVTWRTTDQQQRAAWREMQAEGASKP